jgi:hypothetical protein
MSQKVQIHLSTLPVLHSANLMIKRKLSWQASLDTKVDTICSKLALSTGKQIIKVVFASQSSGVK